MGLQETSNFPQLPQRHQITHPTPTIAAATTHKNCRRHHRAHCSAPINSTSAPTARQQKNDARRQCFDHSAPVGCHAAPVTHLCPGDALNADAVRLQKKGEFSIVKMRKNFPKISEKGEAEEGEGEGQAQEERRQETGQQSESEGQEAEEVAVTSETIKEVKEVVARPGQEDETNRSGCSCADDRPERICARAAAGTRATRLVCTQFQLKHQFTCKF